MKVLKRCSWSPDGIKTFSLAPGDDVPEEMPGEMVSGLKAAGYIGGRESKAEVNPVPENKMEKDPVPENKEETSEADETIVPDGYEELEADDMKALALKLTGRNYTSKTAAKKAIAEVQSRESSAP